MEEAKKQYYFVVAHIVGYNGYEFKIYFNTKTGIQNSCVSWKQHSFKSDFRVVNYFENEWEADRYKTELELAFKDDCYNLFKKKYFGAKQ